MADTLPTLRAQDLTVAFDNHTIIDGISFTVPPGETTAIIGPNGAGKSILIKALLGLVPKQSGTVEFWGEDSRFYPRFAHRISYIPQSLSLESTMPLTVGGLFALTSNRVFGLSREEKSRMEELLTLVGIAADGHSRLSTLSGGQLQRVFIAYSLMRRPDLLILDEPSAGIDVSGQESVYSLLRRIQTKEKVTLLLVSHELDIVMRYAHQVLCLNRQLLCAGIPREVLSNELLAQMYGSDIGHFEHTHQR